MPGTYVVRKATRVPHGGDDGDRVAGDQRGVGDGGDVDDHEQLDEPDGYQHRDVEPDHPLLTALALDPVGGPDEIDEQGGGEHRGEAHQEDSAYSVGLAREERGVLHLVRRTGRLRERSGQSAVGVVVVALRPHSALQ